MLCRWLSVRRAFQRKETVKAKALRQECAWCFGAKGRRLVKWSGAKKGGGVGGDEGGDSREELEQCPE